MRNRRRGRLGEPEASMPCTGLLEAGFREILPGALTGGTSMRSRVVARSGNWGPVLAATAAATFVIVVSLIFADTAQEAGGARRETQPGWA